MTNTEKIKQVFLTGLVKEATNSELLKLTGIQPHAQVYQITSKLVSQGFLKYAKRGKEKVFYLAHGGSGTARYVDTAYLNERKQNIDDLDSSPQSVQTLTKLSFELVGKWSVDNAGKLRHGIDADILSRYPALYAFVIRNQVMYIGKTAMPLGKRLYGYINPGPKQSTNQKNNKNIRNALSRNQDVEIWVFSPPADELIYRGVPINLPAGLEDAIIERIAPRWNQTGK